MFILAFFFKWKYYSFGTTDQNNNINLIRLPYCSSFYYLFIKNKNKMKIDQKVLNDLKKILYFFTVIEMK